TSENSRERRIRPVDRLSTARVVIPAKKHHVAKERFLDRAAKARIRLNIAAAKGRTEKGVTGSQPAGSAAVPGAVTTTTAETEGPGTARKTRGRLYGELRCRPCRARCVRKAVQ